MFVPEKREGLDALSAVCFERVNFSIEIPSLVSSLIPSSVSSVSYSPAKSLHRITVDTKQLRDRNEKTMISSLSFFLSREKENDSSLFLSFDSFWNLLVFFEFKRKEEEVSLKERQT